jgi:DNA-binding response OmpR family regulator
VSGILLVEDDPLIRSFVEEALRDEGHATTVAPDSALASSLAVSQEFDLIILDMVLPDGDGLRLLRSIRSANSTVPVLVITGHPERHGVVECLNCGADDYLVKPLRLDELLARVRRRLQDRPKLEPTSLTAGPIRLDLPTRRVTVAGHAIELSNLEFSLLETFLRHPEQVLSREQLLSQVWGTQIDPMTNVVAVAVRRLRNKIGREFIETVRDAGYRLTCAGWLRTNAVSTGCSRHGVDDL